VVKNAVVGPNVSLGKNARIDRAIVRNSIVGDGSTIAHAVVSNAMLGNFAVWNGVENEASLSDYSTLGTV